MNNLKELTNLFSEIPGISTKIAQRLSIAIVEKPEIAINLEKITNLSKNLIKDELTGLIIPANSKPNENKEKDVLLIIESNNEVLNILEKTRSNKSMFILDMVNKRDFKNTEKVLKRLFTVLENYETREILFLLSPSIESELIMRVIKEELENIKLPIKPKLTRLQMGIPFGGSIEFSDERTMKAAIENREDMNLSK